MVASGVWMTDLQGIQSTDSLIHCAESQRIDSKCR